MLGYKTHLKSIFILSLLVGLVLLALFAGAAVLGDFISQDVINTSSNGLFVGSDNSPLTNGTTAGYDLNVSGGIFLNVSLKANQTHGNYVNFSFWFTKTSPESVVYWGANGSMMLNFTTITNTTKNQTSYFLRLNGTDVNTANGLAYSFLPDGYYNVSIMVQNATANSPTGDGEHIVNFSRIVNLLIDRVAPPIQTFALNVSGSASNLTFAGGNTKLTVNATVNDTIFTQSVRIGFRNAFANTTEFNVTASRGNSTGANGAFMFAVEVDTALMTDGTYTVAIYANDSLKNNNVSIANLSFVIDRDGPNVTGISLGNITTTEFNLSRSVIDTNAIVNLTVFVNDSFSSYPSPWDMPVYFNITNGTNGTQLGFVLAEANETLWNASVAVNLSDKALFPDGIFYITVWTNDSINNLNRTQNLTFRIDGNAPTIGAFVMNSTGTLNASNYSNGNIDLNASVNDTVTTVQSVRFNLLNSGNGTEWNVTASKNYSTFNTQLEVSRLADGLHTVGIYTNDTVSNLNNSVFNLSFRVDKSAPFIRTYFTNNSVNNASTNLVSNFTGGVVEINASINDSVTSVGTVVFGLFNTVNGTEFNVSVTKNFSFYHAQVPLATMTDGLYNIRLHADDILSNRNSTVVNTSFVIDRSPPNVNRFFINFTADLNTSNHTGGVIGINVTVNDSITSVTTVRVGYTNDFRNGTEVNLTLPRNFSVYHNVLPLSTMTDGLYTLRVYADDVLDNRNLTVANLSFRLDRVPPNVSSASLVMGNISGYGTEDGSPVGYNFSAALAEGNMSLQITVNDSTTHVTFVRFNVSNSSGGIDQLHGPFNYTANRSGNNFTNAPSVVGSEGNLFNLSQLAEGRYNVTIVANDSVNNRNKTVYMAFMIDRTKPGVSVSCSPSAATAGQTVTCTCTTTDSLAGVLAGNSGFSGGVTTESTTAAGSGTFTSTTCTGVDYAGNRNTATGSWTVTAASTGGSGGGGSGGGISSGVVGTFEKKVWTSIKAGETATVAVRNSVLGVTEVSFAVEETTFGAVVEVKKADSLPSTVESYSGGPVYKTLQITERNVEKALKGTATVDFKVEKAWLADNKLAQDDVALHRYSDGAWQQLGTSFKSEDGTYVYYSAQTPGFSYFVIAKKGGAAPVAAAAAEGEAAGAAGEAAVPAVETPAETSVESGAEEAALGMGKKSKAVWIVPLVILVVVLGLLYWYWGRRR